MQKRTVRRRTAKKAVPRARKRAVVMDENLRRLIRREASKAKLSEEEYLRLAVNVSEMMRTSSVVPAGLFDSGLLKMILANPAMLNMLKGVIGNVWSKVGSGKESGTSAAATGAPRMPGMPGTMPMRQPWGGPMGPRPYPGAGMMPGMPGMMPGMGPQSTPPAADGSAPSSEGGGMDLDGLMKMAMQFFGNSNNN